MITKWCQTTNPKPNKSVWTYWQQLIDTITHHNSQRLKRALGKWTENCFNLRRIYTHYYNQGNRYQYKNGILRKIDPGNSEPTKKDKLSAQAVPAIHTLTGITLKTKQLKIIDPEIPISSCQRSPTTDKRKRNQN
jgi:hypothetical protein